MTSLVRVVLIEPSHPGNIGSVARAMKNMGLSELVLVRPRQFPHAIELAILGYHFRRVANSLRAPAARKR